MERRRLGETEFRFGEFGPGYLLRGPRTDLGVVRLRPGDDASNHYHRAIEETFVVIEGSATLWLNGRERFSVTVGDVCQMDPGDQHYFVNESDAVFRAIFIKAPYDPLDGVQVPWVPGDPLPELAS
ncbi:cupin domain-containing protein [Pengzhenrongella frigida]|uniref:Cupin domain-containing protein n=1 Tax=Pengzhenrongella frigida TaxID=1259133 RepID=A0A4Q5MZX0_9MICO|nr:cupin domain-containing protein [Cellulomonas sp. HLT2-17]RYV49777.1 cupin domain-containing protein [Cellulomonas sp. HLT2-17]